MIKIYTLGTSNRSIDDFLEILKSYQIQTVIDVRRWPTSKWFEHFKKENLEKTLPENNIQYLHFEKLGGYRTGGYEEYIKTKEFKEALEELLKISESQNTVLICAEKLPWTPPTHHPPRLRRGTCHRAYICIICAEKLPWKCHRAIIARELEKKKIEVIHVIEKDRLWQSKKRNQEK